MSDRPPIEWRVHLNSSPAAAYEAWATDLGRERFWAERSEATPDGFRLSFIGGEVLDVRLVETIPSRRFAFNYFGSSRVVVQFETDASGSCDVHLTEEGVPETEYMENYAGWVSVLLSLKAAVDFGVDLRGHDPARSWRRRFVDN